MEEVEQEYRDRKLEVKRVVREEKDMMGGVCTEITGRQHRDYENAVWNILKQPKVRAPFRDLGLNLSTDDEGTANMTRTRRVSFSVTQIKEFHSNADVDTFWGSTYEKKFQQTDSSSNSSCESSSFSLRGVNTTICTGVDTAGRLVDDQSLEPVKISSWRHDHQRQITQESTHLKPSDLPSCDKSLSDTLLKETRFQAFECHNNSDSLLSFASVQKESDFTGDFMKKVGRQSPDKPFSPVFKFDINSSKKPMCSDIFGFPGKKCSYIEIPKNILHGSHSKELNLFSKLIVTDKLVSIGNRPASDNSNIKSEEAQHLSYSFDKARIPDRNEHSHHKQSRISLNISCSSSMDSVSMNEDDSVFLNQSSSSEEINPTTLTQNTNLAGFLSVPVKHDDTNVKNSTYYHQDFTGSTMGCVKILGGNQSTSRFQETSVNLDKTQASLSGEKSSENGTEYIDKLMLSHVNKSCHTNLDLTNALKTIQGRIPSINESVNSDMDCTEPLGGIIGGISNLRETLVKSDMECTKTGGGINCGMSHLNESVTSDMEYTEPIGGIQNKMSQLNESVKSNMECTEPFGGIHSRISQLNESAKSNMEGTETLGGIHNIISQLNESVKSDMEFTEPLGGIHNKMSQLNKSAKSNMECTEPFGGIHNRISQLNESAKSNMEGTETLGGIHNRISQLNESFKSNMECTEPLGGIHYRISQLNESSKSDMECIEPLGGISNRTSQLNESAKSNMECTETFGGIHNRMSQLDKSAKSDMECTEPLGGIHNRMSQLNKFAKSDMECTEPLGGISNRTSQLNESAKSNIECTEPLGGIHNRISQLNESARSNMECTEPLGGIHNRMSQQNESTKSNMECTEPLGGIHNRMSQLNEYTKSNMECTEPLGGINNKMSQLNESVKPNMECTEHWEVIHNEMSQLNESSKSNMECTEPLGGIHNRTSQLNETSTTLDMEYTDSDEGINCRMSQLNEATVNSDIECLKTVESNYPRMSQLNEVSIISDMELTEVSGGIHDRMSQLNETPTNSDKECIGTLGAIESRTETYIISNVDHTKSANCISSRILDLNDTSVNSDIKHLKVSGDIMSANLNFKDNLISNMNSSKAQEDIGCVSPVVSSNESDKNCLDSTEMCSLSASVDIRPQLAHSLRFDVIKADELVGKAKSSSQTSLCDIKNSFCHSLEFINDEELAQVNQAVFGSPCKDSNMEISRTVVPAIKDCVLLTNQPILQCELTNPSLSNSVSYKICKKLSKAMVPLEHKDTEQCTKLIDTQIVSQKSISVQSPTNETFKEILSRSISNQGFAELVKHPQREEKTKSIHLVDLCNSSLNQLHSEENNSRTFPESVMELSDPIKQGNEEASMKSNDLCDISCSQSDNFKFETTKRSCHGIDMECTKVIPSLDDSSKETLGSSLNRGVFCVQSQKSKSVSMGGPQTSELIFEVNNDNNKTICLDSQSKSEISSHLVNTFPSVSDHDQRILLNQSPVFFDVKNMESLSAKHDTTRFGKGNQSYLHTLGTNVEQTTKPIKEISLVKRCVVSSDKGNQVPSMVAEDKIDEKSNPSLTIQELHHKERMPNSPTHDLALNKLTLHKSVSETGNNDMSPLPLKHSLIDDSHEHISLNTKLENSCVLDLSHLPPKKRAYEISAQLSESNLEVDLIPCKKQCIPAEIHKPTSLLEDVSSNEMCLNDICGTTQCNQGKHMPHKNTSSSEKSVSFVNSSCTTCDTSMLLCQPALPYNSSDNLSKDMTIKQVYEGVTNMVEYLHNLPENCSKVVNKNISIVDQIDGGAGNTNVSFHPDIKKLDSFDSSNELLQPNREIPSEPRNMVNTLPNISSNGYTALIENSFISTDSSSMLPKDQNLDKYDEYIVKSTILNDSRNAKMFSASPDETLYQKDTQQCDVTTSLKIDTPTDFIDNDINKETQSNTTKTSADAVQGTLEKELSRSIQSKASGMSFYGKENNMLHSPDSYKDNSDVKLTDEVDKSQEVCLRSDQYTKHATIVSSVAVNDRDSSRFLEFQHKTLSDSDVPKTVAFETTDCVPMTSSLIKLSYALCSDGPTSRQGEGASEFSVMPSPKRDTPRTDDLANLNKSMAHMATKSPISKAPSNTLVAKKMLFTVEEVIQEKYSNKSSPLAIKAMNDLEWAFTFLYDSLELIIKLETNKNSIYKSVTVVFLHSRVTEKTDSMGRWAHHVVLAKWSNGYLQSRCKTTQHVPKLLDDLSGTITQLTEFIMEYDCIRAKELVRIADNKVSFDMSSMEPLLWFRVTVDLSHWEIVLPSDISIQDIVGHVRTQDVQNLVSGVDKGPQFLRHYIRDINEYLNILNLYHQ
uniref:Uncharacterized protein n=1 Tax=Timema bartmani TaxID=61472 RepID=A0A7R9ERJ1_9NEOP|nr:unnamed protein product [Timema bartmani]